MTIYTIEAHGRPVVVVSVGDAPSLEDSLATKPELLRATRDLEAQAPADMGEHLRRRAMDEALDTWLGEDLVRPGKRGAPALGRGQGRLARQGGIVRGGRRLQGVPGARGPGGRT